MCVCMCECVFVCLLALPPRGLISNDSHVTSVVQLLSDLGLRYHSTQKRGVLGEKADSRLHAARV